MERLIRFLVLLGLIIFLVFGVPFIFMLAWNYVFNYFNQPQLIINYWVAFLILFLLGFIGKSSSGNK